MEVSILVSSRQRIGQYSAPYKSKDINYTSRSHHSFGLKRQVGTVDNTTKRAKAREAVAR